MALPRSLMFPGLKPEAVKAEVIQYAVPVAPGSGTTVPAGGAWSHNIPASQKNFFLDPSGTYLRFKVTPSTTGGTTPTVAALGHDFIKSLTLCSSEGQQQQEVINDYAPLYTALRDLCSEPGARMSKDSITLNSDVARQRAPAVISTTTGFEFCIPLLSSIGLLSGLDRMIPVCALSAPLRLDIVLNSANRALAATGAPTTVDYTVSGISLNVTYVRLTDGAMSRINEMTRGVYQWSTSLWKDSAQTHPANQSTNSMQLTSSKCNYAKTLIAVQRLSNTLENSAFYSNIDRQKNYLSSYQWKIGSTVLNQKPVDTTNMGVEAFMQAQRAFSCPTDEDRATLLDATSWIKQGATTPSGSANPGSFVICQELQSYPNQSGMSDGQNTWANQPTIDLVYDSAQLANVGQVLWSFYTECDAVSTVANGQYTIVA